MISDIIEFIAIGVLGANGWATIHLIRVIWLTEFRGFVQKTVYVKPQ